MGTYNLIDSLIINNDLSWYIKVLAEWIDTACQRQCITYVHWSHKIDMVSVVLVSSRLNRTNRVSRNINIATSFRKFFINPKITLLQIAQLYKITFPFLIYFYIDDIKSKKSMILADQIETKRMQNLSNRIIKIIIFRIETQFAMWHIDIHKNKT